MAKQNINNLPEDRRKRIQRLKKIIVGTIIAAIVIPIVISICLGIRLHIVNRSLKATQLQNEELQAQLDKYMPAEAEVEEEVSVDDQTENDAAEKESGSYWITNETTLTGTGNENANSSQDAEFADGKKHVYLTFDDGPSSNTDEILDILKKYDVKATFFVVGNTSDHGRELLKRIVDEGHSIGVHSYTHQYASIYDTEDAYFTDYNAISDYIYESTGVKTKICRLPGGSSNTVSKIKMSDVVRQLNEKGVTCFDWNISGGDATGQEISAQTISDNVLKGVDRFQASVVLLHDGAGKASTVDALDIILKDLTTRDEVVIEPITDETPVILHISL